MLQRSSEGVFRKTVVFKCLELNFKLKDLKSLQDVLKTSFGKTVFKTSPERPPIAHAKILNTSWNRFKIEKLPFLERLHLDLQVMRFEYVYKMHLRSLEMLLSVRLRNAFKLLTPKCFEGV